jgi:hypothetical protein
MTFSFPKEAFPLAHLCRTANAALTRAFRHLRDCDAALHRGRGGSWRRQTGRNNRPQQSSRDNRRNFFLILIARVAEIGSNSGLNATAPITILCAARPFVIDGNQRCIAARDPGPVCHLGIALSPECHKARPKVASHTSRSARDCHPSIASACSGRG